MTPDGVEHVVIGLGNPYHRDDGVGPATICRLRWLGLPGVTLATSAGDAIELVELWTGQESAVVVAGVRTGQFPPGRLHRLSLNHPAVAGAVSADRHRIALNSAVRLARTLGRTPRRLLFIAVEVADVSRGHGLSPVVATSLGRVTDEIVELLAPHPHPVR